MFIFDLIYLLLFARSPIGGFLLLAAVLLAIVAAVSSSVFWAWAFAICAGVLTLLGVACLVRGAD